MLKSGDIVVQDRTMINNVNYKDNKENRLSVVLFETTIDEESFICTCPITNQTKAALKFPNNYYSSPFLIFGEKKYSCVKIDSAHIYPRNIVHSTGIVLSDFHMERIFEKLMNYVETSEQEELYRMIRESANIHKEKISNLSRREIKIAQQRKRKNKQLKRERIRNAKRGINMA